MKQRLYTLLLLALLSISAWAQSDQGIVQVLDGRYRKHSATTDVTITGERLSSYNLVLYHSLTVVNDAEIMEVLLNAFLTDIDKADAKDLSYVGSHLYYGFIQYKWNRLEDMYNRYAFFKDLRYAPENKEDKVIIIYMEGPASLKTLKSKFSK